LHEFIVQQIVNFVAIGSIYALIAIGFTLVFGVLQMINFAHSDIFMSGAFAMLSVWGALTAAAAFAPHILLLVVGALLVALVIGGLGMLIERLAYRPLRHSSRLGPLLSALGVSIVLQNIVIII